MDNLEKVEKIREKTGVSYEEAKNALEICDWDVLDAIVYLEKSGKVKAPEVPVYTTKAEQSEEFKKTQKTYEENEKSFGDVMKGVFTWLGNVVKKGCESTFEVNRHGERLMSMPFIILVLLLIFAFWVTLPLLIIGLFCDFKYSFKGPISNKVDINEVCDKASEACDNIKNDISGNK